MKALEPNDFFTDMAAFFHSIVSKSYYGILGGQIHTNLPPEHPIIATQWHNGIQDGPSFVKKVYSFANWKKFTVHGRKSCIQKTIMSVHSHFRQLNSLIDSSLGLLCSSSRNLPPSRTSAEKKTRTFLPFVCKDQLGITLKLFFEGHPRRLFV